MLKPSIPQLAKELVEVRAKLNEFEDAYKQECQPYLEAKAAIQTQLLESMREQELLSTRYEDFTVVRKTTKKAVVMNEFDALAQLKQTKPEYVIEAISLRALKEVEKGTLKLDGVQVESKEFISITQKQINPSSNEQNE